MDSDTDIAIYLRVSTKDKGQDENNQLRQCLELAKEYSSRQPDIYREQMSAYTKDVDARKQLSKCLEYAKNGRYKHIICWDTDRLHRNRERLVRDITAYQLLGCSFHFVNQKFFEILWKIPAPWNKMFFDFLIQLEGYRGEEESRIKGLRIKEAFKAGRGRDNWGRPKVDIPADKICDAFYLCDCNRERTSKYLGIGLVTLRKLMREYGIEGEKIKI